MKRILLAFATVALLLPSAPRAEADVSIDFFYTNLSGGSWIEVGDYGYCWQPEIAVSDSRWRPYADGYWAYTDLGWTWVSYEDFGWATYHYGRWARLRDHGWVWVPGYEWGPAWVSWRTGGDYVGWAPLPPRYRGREIVYDARPIGTHVDIEFDIGPAYYNFVDIRYIGAPVLREHIYEPSRNITYINQTVNVTNITYNNSVVHNYGPDYTRLSAYSTRPIQRLNLERQRPADFNARGRSGDWTKVQGDKLIVAAPQVVEKPQERVAPPKLKTKVESPNLETGWVGISDSNAKAQLQEKMKKEDPKNVPPPQVQPRNPEALNAAAPAASPGAASATAPSAGKAAAPGTQDSNLDRNAKGKGKGKRGREDAAPTQPEQADGSTPPQPGDAAAASADNDEGGRGNRNKDRRGRDQVQPPAPSQQPAGSDAASAAVPDPASVAPAPREQSRGKGKRGAESPGSNTPRVPAADAPTIGAPKAANDSSKNDRAQRGNKGRGREDREAPRSAPAELQPPSKAPARSADVPKIAAPDEGENRGRGRGKVDRDRVNVPPQSAPSREVAPVRQVPVREAVQERARGRRERQEAPANIAPPRQRSAPAAGGPPPKEGRSKPERGDKKKKDKDED